VSLENRGNILSLPSIIRSDPASSVQASETKQDWTPQRMQLVKFQTSQNSLPHHNSDSKLAEKWKQKKTFALMILYYHSFLLPFLLFPVPFQPLIRYIIAPNQHLLPLTHIWDEHKNVCPSQHATYTQDQITIPTHHMSRLRNISVTRWRVKILLSLRRGLEYYMHII
jgi:hypothetical protein